jgi:twitching motility protein PilT
VREDPDAILVGEMRDLETISMALNAAETGVLVFGTLHTNSAAKTLDRIINVFPADKQAGVRGTLASVTKAVVAQQLLRKKGGGRAPRWRSSSPTPAMSSLLRDGKTHQIGGLIKLGKKDGMIAMDDALRKLADDDLIEPTRPREVHRQGRHAQVAARPRRHRARRRRLSAGQRAASPRCARS